MSSPLIVLRFSLRHFSAASEVYVVSLLVLQRGRESAATPRTCARHLRANLKLIRCEVADARRRNHLQTLGDNIRHMAVPGRHSR